MRFYEKIPMSWFLYLSGLGKSHEIVKWRWKQCDVFYGMYSKCPKFNVVFQECLEKECFLRNER